MKKMILLLCLFFVSIGEDTIAAERSEKILGVMIDFTGITFQVLSGGCTNKTHFKVSVTEGTPIKIELIRVQPDLCEAYFPYGTKVRYSFDEMNIKKGEVFRLVNELSDYLRAN